MQVNAELFFIRHAESNGNIGLTLPGEHPDDPRLTENGLFQAKRLAERFLPGTVNALYVSALIRACQTMQPAAEKLGMPMQVMRELMEVGTEIPNADPALATSFAPNAFRSLSEIAGQPVLFAPEDGTPEVCEKRAAYCVDTIVSNCRDGDRVLICTHGGFIGYLLRYCLGLSLPEHFNWQIDNTAVFGIRLSADRIPKLICANDVSHLK